MIAMVATAALALTGCYKDDPVYRHDGRDPQGNGGGRQETEKLVVTERPDWSIRRVAREDWVNDDGSVDKVEHFNLKYTGNGYYIIRLVRPEDFRTAYENDAAGFFTYEAQTLLSDAEADNVKFYQYTDEVFTRTITDVYFDRLRSGTWMAFLIELDSNGKATGNYAEADFSIQEEVASDAFNRWLGTWLVSNGRVGYDLNISSIDNNFIYKIEGWEQGPAESFQMDQEYLEGEFYEPNGFLYIVSQYLGTYDDEKLGTVDELFMGNIFDSGGITLITDEGLDIAVMVTKDEGAELQPLEVTLKTDSGDYTTPFHSMQYYMWAHESGEWHPYNENVAALPLTMTWTGGTRASGIQYTKPRVATKASIHHGQPKAGGTARRSVAKKAVRMK